MNASCRLLLLHSVMSLIPRFALYLIFLCWLLRNGFCLKSLTHFFLFFQSGPSWYAFLFYDLLLFNGIILDKYSCICTIMVYYNAVINSLLYFVHVLTFMVTFCPTVSNFKKYVVLNTEWPVSFLYNFSFFWTISAF